MYSEERKCERCRIQEEVAATAAARTAANQNLLPAAATSTAVSHVGTLSTHDNISAEAKQESMDLSCE